MIDIDSTSKIQQISSKKQTKYPNFKFCSKNPFTHIAFYISQSIQQNFDQLELSVKCIVCEKEFTLKLEKQSYTIMINKNSKIFSSFYFYACNDTVQQQILKLQNPNDPFKQPTIRAYNIIIYNYTNYAILWQGHFKYVIGYTFNEQLILHEGAINTCIRQFYENPLNRDALFIIEKNAGISQILLTQIRKLQKQLQIHEEFYVLAIPKKVHYLRAVQILYNYEKDLIDYKKHGIILPHIKIINQKIFQHDLF